MATRSAKIDQKADLIWAIADLSIISICRSQQLSFILLMADAGMIIPTGRMYLNTVKMAVFRQ